MYHLQYKCVKKVQPSNLSKGIVFIQNCLPVRYTNSLNESLLLECFSTLLMRINQFRYDFDFCYSYYITRGYSFNKFHMAFRVLCCDASIIKNYKLVKFPTRYSNLISVIKGLNRNYVTRISLSSVFIYKCSVFYIIYDIEYLRITLENSISCWETICHCISKTSNNKLLVFTIVNSL